ncbi:hypothetical protein [Flavobacterium sp.]|uniref:hypothetical protein n=1 Tax=Flavobacterium sp. TaxID=239 RepID=UPI0025FA8DFC|nr:hypothetical protein [Flavobacterium sp.]
MIKNKLRTLIKKFFLHKNEELSSFSLNELYHHGSYLPYTTSSLKFRFLACLVNDGVVSNRTKVLKFEKEFQLLSSH